MNFYFINVDDYLGFMTLSDAVLRLISVFRIRLMWILQIILILFPGQSDLAAYPLTEKSIKSALAAGTEFRVEYFIEYMDRYRNSDQTHYCQVLDLYRHKYSGKKIDLIIAFSSSCLGGCALNRLYHCQNI